MISKVKIIRMTNSIYIRAMVTCVLSLAEEVLLSAVVLFTIGSVVVVVVLVVLVLLVEFVAFYFNIKFYILIILKIYYNIFIYIHTFCFYYF